MGWKRSRRLFILADLYFDDSDWAARYLVADTGTWLPGRQVLLSLRSLGDPDRSEKRIPVRLTKERIRNAPSPDTDRPVSRQFEAGFNAYHSYPAYWEGPYIWGGAFFPGYNAAHLGSGLETPSAEEGGPSRRGEKGNGIGYGEALHRLYEARIGAWDAGPKRWGSPAEFIGGKPGIGGRARTFPAFAWLPAA